MTKEQSDKKNTATSNIHDVIEKWVLFFFILCPYLFFSYRIIYAQLHPDPSIKCGNGAIALMFGQVFLAFLATLILGIKMFNGKSYGTLSKIIVLSIIFIPLIIFLLLFYQTKTYRKAPAKKHQRNYLVIK